MVVGVHSLGGGSDGDGLWEHCVHARKLGCCMKIGIFMTYIAIIIIILWLME